ncbi:hypothetical protein ACIO13_21745 [Streptomyces sp. NPDC087425]|uniref:hypothetical protein n=1 Tax=unclassified Streptomyces TaxID=2593676 RepID=UPI0024767812|nr:hypothetical protein [Streptomyces sp. LBL]
MSSSNTTVPVTFSADEYAAVAEQAAQRGVPLDTYIRQAAAQRAHDGKSKNALIQEIAARRGQSVKELLKPGFLIDTDDIIDAELDRRLPAALGTQAEPETNR